MLKLGNHFFTKSSNDTLPSASKVVVAEAAAVVRNTPGAALLDVSSDQSHNRSVITLVGDAAGAEEAAVRLTRIRATTSLSSSISSADAASASRASRPPTGTSSRHTSPASRPLDDAVIADIEHRLARLIGPVARILVGRALKRTSTEQALLEELARDISDPVQRAAFLSGK